MFTHKYVQTSELTVGEYIRKIIVAQIRDGRAVRLHAKYENARLLYDNVPAAAAEISKRGRDYAYENKRRIRRNLSIKREDPSIVQRFLQFCNSQTICVKSYG